MDAFAREGDIVAGSILDEVHGLVSHAQDFPVGTTVARECGYAEAGSHLMLRFSSLKKTFEVSRSLRRRATLRAFFLEVWGSSTTNSSPP